MMPGLDGFEVVPGSAGRTGMCRCCSSPPVTRSRTRCSGCRPAAKRLRHQAVQASTSWSRGCVALLRRSGHREETTTEAAVLRYADLELNEDSYEVFKSGQAVQLSLTEFKLLRCLLENAERVMSKGQILSAVWNYDFAGDAGVVRVVHVLPAP